MQAKRASEAGGGSRHRAMWQHAIANDTDRDGAADAEEPWLDPALCPVPPGPTARVKDTGGEGRVDDDSDEGPDYDQEAVSDEELLAKLGRDPAAGRTRRIYCSALDTDQDGEEKEDAAILLQLASEKERRARFAEIKARRAVAAAASGSAISTAAAGDPAFGSETAGSSDSDEAYNSDGKAKLGEQIIRTFPLETDVGSGEAPSNLIYHPEDPSCPAGDLDVIGTPSRPPPGLFSSLDAESRDDGPARIGITGPGTQTGWHPAEAPRPAVEGEDGGSTLLASASGEGQEWLLEVELAEARAGLPPVQWVTPDSRLDERGLAEIGRYRGHLLPMLQWAHTDPQPISARARA